MQVEDSHVIVCLIDSGEVQRFALNTVFQGIEITMFSKPKFHRVIRCPKCTINIYFPMDRIFYYSLELRTSTSILNLLQWS